jgi:hypothetical protein
MLMQILHAGGLPMAYDQSSRPADDDNPKGYFELEGGKIISRLMDQSFPLDEYKGKFIKITAYGLKFLLPGNYKIIYSQRNLEEILDSMEKMAKIKDTERDDTRVVFTKLNEMIIRLIDQRDDTDVLYVNYNAIVANPEDNIKKIYDFLDSEDIDFEKMLSVVDEKLYRKRRI